MINALDKLLAFILITILLFVIPTYNMLERQDDINYHLVTIEANKLADMVCEIGYIDELALRKLRASLAASGASYDIDLVHMKKHFMDREDESSYMYYMGNYTDDIYKEIRVNKKYYMDLGDFFYISIKRVSASPNEQVKKMFFSFRGENMLVRAGGLIRAEAD